MAVAYQPFYSTSYGESHGYNEREGSNLNHFRNRYMNDSYRGSANLGPTRFHGTTQSLAATERLQATQAVKEAAPMPVNVNTSTFSDEAFYKPAQTVSQGNRSYTAPLAYSSTSTTAPIYSSAQPASARQSPFQYNHIENYSTRSIYQPAQRTSDAVFHQSFSRSSYDVPISYHTDSSVVLRPPYYIPPPAAVPTSNPFSATFGSAGVSVQSAKVQEPAQSLPFNRLHAAKPSNQLNNAAYESSQSARPVEPKYNRGNLTADKLESMNNYGKLSISRRLPEGERLRYHVPNYMGFVRTTQFRHGDTYGRATRKALADMPW